MSTRAYHCANLFGQQRFAFGRDVKDHCFGRDLLDNRLDEDLNFGVADVGREQGLQEDGA